MSYLKIIEEENKKKIKNEGEWANDHSFGGSPDQDFKSTPDEDDIDLTDLDDDNEDEKIEESKKYFKAEVEKSPFKGRGPWMIELYKDDGTIETSFHKTEKEANEWSEKYMSMTK
jgi:hypothetical protein